MREGGRLPERIANAPQLQLGLALYYDAFWELDTCRSTGWGYGPIPWSAMRDYAVTFELEPEQEECLYYYVRRMDSEFLRFHSKGNKWQPPTDSSNSHSAWPSAQKRSASVRKLQ